jgi:hypothetical protein
VLAPPSAAAGRGASKDIPIAAARRAPVSLLALIIVSASHEV